MHVSAARPEAVQAVAVRRWPRGCVMRECRVPARCSHCARYTSTHHTQGSRNRHGWIDQASRLLLRRRRAQAFVRANQQVSSSFFPSDVSLTRDRPRFFEDGAWYRLRTALTALGSSARTSPPLPKYSVRVSRSPLFIRNSLYLSQGVTTPRRSLRL
jgi:hypothetical protein